MKRIITCLIALAMLTMCFAIPAGAEGEFKLLHTVRISDTEIAYVFNKEVADANLPNNFVCLRWQKMEGDVIKGLAWDGETPLQAASGAKKFLDDAHKNIVVVEFAKEDIDAWILTTESEWYNMGYRAFAGMEECNPGAGHDHATLQTALAADGTELSANYNGPNDDWDGAYCPISVDYNFVAKVNGEGFYLLHTVRISDTEIAYVFNKEVADANLPNNFVCLRWQNMDGNTIKGLAWDGENPLQAASGAKRFYDDAHKNIVVVTYDAASIDAWSETAGNKWYDAGCRAFAGMEECNPGEGHDHATLQTALAADGSELSANYNAPDQAWDGAYCPIESDYGFVPELYTYPWVAPVIWPAPVEPEPETTVAPETPAPETNAPDTNAPATTAPATGDATGDATGTTEAPTTEGGCSSMIGMGALVLAAVLAAPVAFKKH